MNFDLYQGRSKRLVVGPLTKPSGGVYAMTGRRLRFMAKTSIVAADADAKLNYQIAVDGTGTVTTANGISFGRPDPTNSDAMIDATATTGYLTIEIEDNDTAALSPGKLFYEIAIVDGTRVYQLRTGEITVIDTLIATV